MLRNIIALLGISLLLTACMSSHKVTYYQLHTQNSNTNAQHLNKELAISVNKVKIADYLKRSAIITQQDKHTLHLSAHNFWAEPLDANLTRVISANIMRNTNANLIVQELGKDKLATYHMSIFVDHIDLVEFSSCNMAVYWQVTHIKNHNNELFQKNVYNESIKGSDYADLVACVDSMVNRLSQDMSRSIKRLKA